MRHILATFLVLTSVSLLAQPTQKWLIKVGKLYDAEHKTFLTNQQILVVNGIIQAVGRNLNKPVNIKVINLGQCTAAPGLMDMHTHLLLHQKQRKDGLEMASKVSANERIRQGLAFAKLNLEAGITTVRDLGNSGQYLDLQLQKILADERTIGPTMYVSGPIISPPGGQFYKPAPADSFLIDQEYRIVKGADDAKAAVEEHIQRGVNVIKVCMNNDNRVLAPEEIKAIVERAHQHGLSVTAHATYDDSARDAVLAGVDGIEHGYSLSDSTLQLMAQRGTYLVPTDVSKQTADIKVAGIGMVGKEAEEYANNFLKAIHDRLRRAVAKGVIIVAGSDYYGDIALIERGKGAVDVLLSYYEAGIPVGDVLSYATYNAAKVQGIVDKVGIIKSGMKADIVFFRGDLENNFAKSLFSVKLIMKDGRLVYPPADSSAGRTNLTPGSR
ncbi:Imidazolonepropionase [Dyadobacter sp. CECT 9623]|uniref:Imidazolonepropionase n=1 Tax=Dyadobacter linearis TaxID=2823330 RepID=A0ABN7RIR0_9BACT|nr:amidohydrolase family protein [Dyadobacter sp. CECT 9623]CAG5074578.1 Imidazolonepropionase [Dyadobacter sp. CECT 9623]